jgi:hypothetical protein
VILTIDSLDAAPIEHCRQLTSLQCYWLRKWYYCVVLLSSVTASTSQGAEL